MSQLNLFNSGLNKKAASHLIGVSESQVNTNVDMSSGCIVPHKKDTNENTVVGKTIIFFKNKWVYNADKVNYVVFQDKLYYTSGSETKKSNDGLTWDNLGIVKPTNSPTITIGSTGNLTGSYQYCYTYYNNADGSESQPSPYSNLLSPESKSIDVVVVASTDTQVTNIRVYRLGGNFSVMTLAAEIANTSTTYNDNITDTNLPGTILVSQLYGTPPLGLRYLTQSNAMFFGAVSDKLYFSEIAFVNAWSPYNYIDFEEEITGIGAMQNGILVFTAYKTYIITGTSPQSLSKYLLNGNNGCILHDSIRYVNNNLIWLANDGICASSGTDVQSLTRKKLGRLDFNFPSNSIVHEEVYYLSHADGMFVIDFNLGGACSELTGTADSFWVVNDKLYYALNDALYSLFSSKYNRDWKYKTALFPEGALTNIKTYKVVYVSSVGDVMLTIFISNEPIVSVNLTTGVNEVKIPQDNRTGYSICFELSGTGTVNEIEYKSEGRQNGR